MIDHKLFNKRIDEQLYTNEGCCPYYDECCASMSSYKNKLQFYRTRIGKNYDNEPIKILVVGQEDVGEEKKYECCEPVTMKEAGYNKHYLRTFYTVAQILLNNDELPTDYDNDIRREKFEGLRHRFALTNYYKCAFSNDNKNSDVKHSKIMEENCSKHLIEEIVMLKPDIVILQGKNHKTFWNKRIKWSEEACIKKIELNKKHYDIGLYKITDIKGIDINEIGKTIYIIDSYHPTSRGIWTNDNVLNPFIELLNKAKKCIELSQNLS